MTIKILRDKLAPANYQFSIATNMESELDMVNPDDPFLVWRVDWYLAWKKGWYSPKAKLRIFLLDPCKKDFDSIYKQLNEDSALVKFAECSNFACHAMGNLLNSSQVTAAYNVCLVSAGRYLNHTIVVLLPKEAVVQTDGWQKDDLIAHSALIVDPWAMAMGYGVQSALAVKPEDYVYAGLLNNTLFLYQSIHDKTVANRSALSTEAIFSKDSFDAPSTLCSVGRISTERRLALELRLFGSPHNKSSAELSPEYNPTV